MELVTLLEKDSSSAAEKKDYKATELQGQQSLFSPSLPEDRFAERQAAAYPEELSFDRSEHPFARNGPASPAEDVPRQSAAFGTTDGAPTRPGLRDTQAEQLSRFLCRDSRRYDSAYERY